MVWACVGAISRLIQYMSILEKSYDINLQDYFSENLLNQLGWVRSVRNRAVHDANFDPTKKATKIYVLITQLLKQSGQFKEALEKYQNEDQERPGCS